MNHTTPLQITNENILQAILALDAKVEKLEAKIESVDRKIDALEAKFEARFDELETKFEARFAELDAKIDREVASLAESIHDLAAMTAERLDDHGRQLARLRRDVSDIRTRLVSLELRPTITRQEMTNVEQRLQIVVDWAITAAKRMNVPLDLHSSL